MKNTIAILGAGNGGQALAGDLGARGFSVRLWESEGFKNSILPIIENGNKFTVNILGEIKQVKLAAVGTDIEEIMDGADIVCVTAPSYAAGTITNTLAPYIKPDQVLLYCPGSTGNALEGAKILNQYGKKINIAEFATLPYAARLGEPGEVKIFLRAEKIYTGAFPGKNTESIIQRINTLFPNAIVPMASVLESSLNNGNPVTHPIPTILNAARIGLAIPFLFYQEIIPEMANINEKIDEERMQLCDKLGYRRIRGAERLNQIGYSPKVNSLYEAYRQSVPFSNIQAPKTLYDRYIFEDVGYGLQIYVSLGKLLGVDMPISAAVVTLASALVNVDFWTEKNRTLADMCIDGLNVKTLKDFLHNGE